MAYRILYQQGLSEYWKGLLSTNFYASQNSFGLFIPKSIPQKNLKINIFHIPKENAPVYAVLALIPPAAPCFQAFLTTGRIRNGIYWGGLSDERARQGPAGSVRGYLASTGKETRI
jgi:hypothetical protein